MVEGKNNHLDPRSKQVKKEQMNLTFNPNCYLSSVSISQFFFSNKWYRYISFNSLIACIYVCI